MYTCIHIYNSGKESSAQVILPQAQVGRDHDIYVFCVSSRFLCILSLSLHVSMYVYISIYMYMHTYVYMGASSALVSLPGIYVFCVSIYAICNMKCISNVQCGILKSQPPIKLTIAFGSSANF